MQGLGITMLVIVALVLTCIVWHITATPKLTPEQQRRVDLATKLAEAAALLMQANYAYAPSAAHELERDAAGGIRAVLQALPPQYDWRTAILDRHEAALNCLDSIEPMRQQRLASPEVARA